MVEKDSTKNIEQKMKILEMQKELIEPELWDDKTHLDRKYGMHINNFYNVIHTLCNSLGIFNLKHDEHDNGKNYSMVVQSGEKKNFDIHKDFNNQKGEDKLVSYVEINDKTKSKVLLFYSPTKGVNFEYSANLMNMNIQLGKDDFFGKSIEKIINNIGSATEGIDFYVRLDRYNKEPNGLKDFCIATGKDTKLFIQKEKQGDVISTIATLDGLVRGLHSIPHLWLYGENFKHQKEEPLFNLNMKFFVRDWLTGETI